MTETPRQRRLRADRRALERLRGESTIFDFTAHGSSSEWYVVRFAGRGIWRPDGGVAVHLRNSHEVHIKLGAAYPRMMPELQWKTPIFHPNISASGVVCLGGYGTYWVPSLNLDELCLMLWDMIRYQNYDTESPYNREAALWAKSQREFQFPLDPRPLRDRLARGELPQSAATPSPHWSAGTLTPNEVPAQLAAAAARAAADRGPTEAGPTATGSTAATGASETGASETGASETGASETGATGSADSAAEQPEVLFLDEVSTRQPVAVPAEIVDAELVEPDDPDILFID